VRGVPAAQLVYADSQALLLRHAGVLARHLLARGMLLLVRSTAVAAHTATSVFRPREVWFARGASFEDRTDIFASELCVILQPGR
jgi:O-antigen ligase